MSGLSSESDAALWHSQDITHRAIKASTVWRISFGRPETRQHNCMPSSTPRKRD
jgi:hypothetical protein